MSFFHCFFPWTMTHGSSFYFDVPIPYVLHYFVAFSHIPLFHLQVRIPQILQFCHHKVKTHSGIFEKFRLQSPTMLQSMHSNHSLWQSGAPPSNHSMLPHIQKLVMVLEDNLAITRSNVPSKKKRESTKAAEALWFKSHNNDLLIKQESTRILKHTQTTPSLPKQLAKQKPRLQRHDKKRLQFLED